MKPNKITILSALILLAMLTSGPVANATDADDLTQMLHEFLAGVTEAETHDQFWADDLIYTSSRGTRTTKSEIMSGFSGSDDGEGGEPGPVFSAEDVQIQVYGETAIVAFKLVATPPEDSEEMGIQNYLNTGTFLKRDGVWRVVAWQATIVPE
jgi:ketosteroid isomerase-like protein